MNKKIIAIQDSPQQNQEIFLLPPRFFALNIVESTTPCNSAGIEDMIKLLYPGIPNGNEHTRIMSQYTTYDHTQTKSILTKLNTIYTWLKKTGSESKEIIVPLIKEALSDIRCYPDHYRSLERILIRISLSNASAINDALTAWLMPKLWGYRDEFAGDITLKLIKLGGQKMNTQSTHTQNAVIKILDDEFGLYGKKAPEDQFFDTTNLGLMRSVVIALAKEALQTKNVIKHLLEEVNEETIPSELIPEIGKLLGKKLELNQEQIDNILDDLLLDPKDNTFKDYLAVGKEASSKIELTEASVQVLLDNLIKQSSTTENTVELTIPINSLSKEDALASQVLELIQNPNLNVTLKFIDENNDALTGFLTQMGVPARAVLATRLSPDELVKYCKRRPNTRTLCHTLVLVSENNPKTALKVMGELGIKNLMEIPDLFHNLLKTTPDVFADLLVDLSKDPKNAKADVLKVLALTYRGHPLAHTLAEHRPSVLQNILTRPDIKSEDVLKVLALTDPNGGSLAYILAKHHPSVLQDILTNDKVTYYDVNLVLALTNQAREPLVDILANHTAPYLQNILMRPNFRLDELKLVSDANPNLFWSMNTKHPFNINSYKGTANPRYIYSILFPQSSTIKPDERSKLLESIGEKNNLPAYFALNAHTPLSTEENRVLLEKAVKHGSMGIFNILISDQSDEKRIDKLARIAIEHNQSAPIHSLIAKGLSVQYHHLAFACHFYAPESFTELLGNYKPKLSAGAALNLFRYSWEAFESRKSNKDSLSIEKQLIEKSDILSGVIAYFSSHDSIEKKGERIIEFLKSIETEHFPPQCVSDLANIFSRLDRNNVPTSTDFLESLLTPLIKKGLTCDGHAINSKRTYKLIKNLYKKNNQDTNFTRSYWERIKKPFSPSGVTPIEAFAETTRPLEEESSF